MSGFTKIKEGSVEIDHFSASSTIKIIFKHLEQKNQQGEMEELVTIEWLDYAQFSDLKKAVNLTDNWL
jgi:hypothetical protein